MAKIISIIWNENIVTALIVDLNGDRNSKPYKIILDCEAKKLLYNGKGRIDSYVYLSLVTLSRLYRSGQRPTEKIVAWV